MNQCPLQKVETDQAERQQWENLIDEDDKWNYARLAPNTNVVLLAKGQISIKIHT